MIWHLIYWIPKNILQYLGEWDNWPYQVRKLNKLLLKTQLKYGILVTDYVIPLESKSSTILHAAVYNVAAPQHLGRNSIILLFYYIISPNSVFHI